VENWLKSTEKLSNGDRVNNEEFQVLIGSLLGDGCIAIPTGCKNAIYEEPKKLSGGEYLKWKAKILRRFDPQLCYTNKYIKLYTHVHPELTELRRRWYPNGKKSIVYEDVEKLDALGLAVWYQDDGSYSPSSRVCEIYNGFNPVENNILKKILQKKWGFPPSIRSRGSTHKLYFCGKRSREFLKTVAPFISPCMKRKTVTPENLERYQKYLKYQAGKRRERYHSDPEYRAKALQQCKEYRGKHREKVLQRKKEHYRKHREKYRRMHHIYYLKNREKILLKSREYYRQTRKINLSEDRARGR